MRDWLKEGHLFFQKRFLVRDSQLQEMMQFCYYDYKRQFYSAEELLDKEVNLRHMMKPLTYE